jgi:hypothetical protein
MIFRRHTRTTGYAPSWFYAVAAIGFVALTIWAISRQDWLVAVLASAMITVTIAVAAITRRLKMALYASTATTEAPTTEN